MNRLHRPPPGLRPRILADSLRKALAVSPVVVLTGARQTGKSTLALEAPFAAGRRYLTLDDLEVLQLAERDPEALLQSAELLTLDEVQRAPSLLLAIKRAVDRDRRKGRFLLTGSANLLLLRGVSESLAGRAVYLTLGSMTEAELQGTVDPGPWGELLGCRSAAEAGAILDARPERPISWPEAVVRGGFPPAALEDDAASRALWFDGYVRSYLERDLQQIAAIEGLADFRRLLRVAALHTGGLVNQSEMAREVGLSQPTVHRYMNLLEVSYLLHRLTPFVANRRKRLIRTPKLYWGDTGLAAFLAGWKSEQRGPNWESLTGALLENLVLVHLSAWRETQVPRPELLYWRTPSGQEVDFVLERGDRLLPLEVKAASRPGTADVRWLEAFLEEHRDRAPFGLVLCNAREIRPIGRNVLAVPLGRVL